MRINRRQKNFGRRGGADTAARNFADSLKGLRKFVERSTVGHAKAERLLNQNAKNFRSDTGECIFVAAHIWTEIFGGKNCAYLETNMADWLAHAVRTRDSNLVNVLGHLRYEGSGVEQNSDTAAELFRIAAEMDNPEAMVNLARLHRRGDGVNKDETEAFELYRRAAELGNETAMIETYVRYRDGEGVRKNLALAERWHDKIRDKLAAAAEDAYEMGYSYTINALVQYRYAEGRGIYQAHDEKFARQYFGQAMEYFRDAIRYGRRDAWQDLGQFYLYGYGVRKNLARALECFDKCGDWRILADYYLENGDSARAIQYYCKGGEWFYVGEIYRKAGDLERAGEWYAKYFGSYRPDDEHNVLKIAKMYRDGEDYEREAFDDEFEGAKLAADTAKAIAFFELAEDYCSVGDIHKAAGNFAEALAWYEKAVAGEHRAYAIFCIASTHQAAGNLDAAAEFYRQLVDFVPKRETFTSYSPNGKSVGQEYADPFEEYLIERARERLRELEESK